MNITRRHILAGVAGAPILGLPTLSRTAFAQQQPTLLVAAPGVPEGVNPDILKAHTQTAVLQVYENLVRYGRVTKNGRPYPDLGTLEGHFAESWQLGEDQKSYTFKLRPGVRSYYGNELTAEDVQWSWERGIAAKRTGVFVANVASVVEVQAVSKYEVRFIQSKPNVLLPSVLTAYVPGIFDSTEVKKHITEADPWAINWTDQHTAGFGPYHLESLMPGEQAVWVANPNYFIPDKPYFRRVIVRAVPSGANRVTLLRSRQVQWADDINLHQIRGLQNDRNVKVESAPGRRSTSLRMNVSITPFDNLQVRHALAHGIDRALIARTVFGDEAVTAETYIPPGVPGEMPVYNYPYDPAKARELLKQAGYSDGLEIEISHSEENWWQEPVAIQASTQLRQIGVTAKPTRITVSDLRARTSMVRQDLPFFCFEEGPFVLDPVYASLVHVDSKGVNNRASFQVPELDAMIEDSKSISNSEERLALIGKVQKRWGELAPWVPIAYPAVYRAMSPSITNWLPEYIDRWVELKGS